MAQMLDGKKIKKTKICLKSKRQSNACKWIKVISIVLNVLYLRCDYFLRSFQVRS